MKKKATRRKRRGFDTILVRGTRKQYVRVPREKPFDAEHPDYYNGYASVTFKMDTARLRKEFGLSDEWLLIAADTDNRKMSGDMSSWQGITCIFERRVNGPGRAMEILAGGKEESN